MITYQEFEDVMIKRHTKDVYEKLKNASVAIAGAGGLGSNIAISLARAGVGKIFIVDFDRVDLSNINRQQYFIKHIGMYKTEVLCDILKEINPYINVSFKTVTVTEENACKLFKDYDIVCEAFDNAENKAMLVNTLLSGLPNVRVISGSGMAGYLSSNTIKTKKVNERFYICGDFETDMKDVNGLMAPRVAICANHQANMVIRLILGKDI